MPPKYPKQFTYMIIEVNDDNSQDIGQHFEDAIAFIDGAIQKGGSVLVHCAAGISRSGAITCAYLMWKNKWTFDKAFEYGRAQRSKLFPNLGF